MIQRLTSVLQARAALDAIGAAPDLAPPTDAVFVRARRPDEPRPTSAADGPGPA